MVDVITPPILLPIHLLGTVMQGPAGQSAYQLAVSQGFEGDLTTWLEYIRAKNVELQNTGGFIQWRREDGEWANLISVASLKGEKGDSIKGDQGDPGPYTAVTVGNVTTLPSGSPAAVTPSVTSPGNIALNFAIPTGPQGAIGNTGDKGDRAWTPVIAAVPDGERRVIHVYDWTNGTGPKPTTGYLGSSGIMSNIADGIDFRGAPGSAGDGQGDMVAANNLSEVNAALARANLQAAHEGGTAGFVSVNYGSQGASIFSDNDGSVIMRAGSASIGESYADFDKEGNFTLHNPLGNFYVGTSAVWHAGNFNPALYRQKTENIILDATVPGGGEIGFSYGAAGRMHWFGNDTRIGLWDGVNSAIPFQWNHSTKALDLGVGATSINLGVRPTFNGATPFDTNNFNPATKANVNNAVFTGTMTVPYATLFAASTGAEGGELQLQKPVTGSTLGGNVSIDIGTNHLRFFENGGTSRGFAVDLSGCAPGVGTFLWHSQNFNPLGKLDSGTDGWLNDAKSHPRFWFGTSGASISTTYIRGGNIEFRDAADAGIGWVSANGDYTAQGRLISVAGEVWLGTQFISQTGGTFTLSGNSNFTTGGRITGGIISSTGLEIHGPAGSYRNLTLYSGGDMRWSIFADASPEDGNSAGSNLYIQYKKNDGTYNNVMSIRRSDGRMGYNGVIQALDFTQPSDENLKKDWKPFAEPGFSLKLADITWGRHKWKASGKEDFGVGIRSLNEIMPGVGEEDEDGVMRAKYAKAAMMAVIDLSDQVRKLMARVEELEAAK